MSPEDVAGLVGDPAHWRGRISPTAYCTHTLSPVLALTDAWPVEVTAFVVDEADPRAAVVLPCREPVDRGSEGTVRLLQAFRATVEEGKAPLVPA